jgi:hypothetical protein
MGRGIERQCVRVRRVTEILLLRGRTFFMQCPESSGAMRTSRLQKCVESAILRRNNKGEALGRLSADGEDLMAGIANLTSSVATVRKTLLRMMDELAVSGMQHAHREISRGRKRAPRKAERKPKTSCKDMH